MYDPSLKEARSLAASGAYRRVPVSRELLSDFITPIQALRILRGKSGHCFLLESAADSAGWGRYTFLGFDPTLEVTCRDGILQLRNRDTVRTEIQHPAPILRKLLAEHRSPRVPGLPPFTGGLVGYFAYDYLKYAEPSLKLTAQDRERFQDMDLMLFEKVICFDNYRQKIILIANADTEDLDESYPAACGELERMAALLKHGKPMEHRPGRLTTPLTPLFDRDAYCAMVKKGKRGVYGGAVGYLDFTGNMDACIAIRLAYQKNGRVFIRAGAGIVADSVPEKEHQKCINKARAVVSALERARKEADL